MSSKRGDNFPETEPKSELKNPDRRHLLGAAAVAAFTVGQTGSGAARTRRAKKPRVTTQQPVCETADPPMPGHGPKEPPEHSPGSYMDVDSFDPLGMGVKVFHDAKAYRQKVTELARALRKDMNLGTDQGFNHVIRIQYKPSGTSPPPPSADCGCGCS
jgi:hypothetical protein